MQGESRTETTKRNLPRGIVPVLQTPFDKDGAIAWTDVEKLVDFGIAGGATGFLVPAVASEVQTLSSDERQALVRFVLQRADNRVPVIVGASADDALEVAAHLQLADSLQSAGLIAPPSRLVGNQAALLEFLKSAIGDLTIPIVLQDLDWQSGGMSLHSIDLLRQQLPTLAGIKVETVPAGPKYTAIRELAGPEFHISGGWAVPQMIEALDRGIDAMIPECSMVPVYVAIAKLHGSGHRDEAIQLFRRLQPILAFANQEIRTSIAFFKRLLARKGIFRSPAMRWAGFEWDRHNACIADELIDEYLALEADLAPFPTA